MGDIVFDLADLTFVDSIGLHVIAHVAAQLGSRGQVTIERADPWLRKVLAISGIEALVNVEVTERSR